MRKCTEQNKSAADSEVGYFQEEQKRQACACDDAREPVFSGTFMPIVGTDDLGDKYQTQQAIAESVIDHGVSQVERTVGAQGRGSGAKEKDEDCEQNRSCRRHSGSGCPE